jgi:SAM-dependent methyltransferase
VYQWWHLSVVPRELLAAQADGWIGAPGRVLDLGCGLGNEAAYLAGCGWQACGTDLSGPALARAPRGAVPARRRHPAAVRPGLVRPAAGPGLLPLPAARAAARYAAEAARVLRPGGRLLLRACLNRAGTRNDLTEAALRTAFDGWRADALRPAVIASDTREMPALQARLRTAGPLR